jgi:hypothetical protein
MKLEQTGSSTRTGFVLQNYGFDIIRHYLTHLSTSRSSGLRP